MRFSLPLTMAACLCIPTALAQQKEPPISDVTHPDFWSTYVPDFDTGDKLTPYDQITRQVVLSDFDHVPSKIGVAMKVTYIESKGGPILRVTLRNDSKEQFTTSNPIYTKYLQILNVVDGKEELVWGMGKSPIDEMLGSHGLHPARLHQKVLDPRKTVGGSFMESPTDFAFNISPLAALRKPSVIKTWVIDKNNERHEVRSGVLAPLPEWAMSQKSK